MRNSMKDEKLLEKTTYTSVICLRVFGFYNSVLLFMPTASTKLNLKHILGNRGSQWGGGFYGYRLKFWLFYGYRLIFFSYG